MNWYIRIDESQFAQEMARAFYDRLRAVLTPAYQEAVRARLAPEVEARVKKEPEYPELVGGRLRGELGVVDGAAAVADLVKGLTTPPGGLTVEIDGPRLLGEKIDCSVFAHILREDYSEVLGVASARFNARGGPVPWLEWLLLGGRSVIISDHLYLGGNRKGSRTGMGIMRRSPRGWGLQTWGGSPADNWLTRALAAFHKVMADVLADELVRRF